MRKMPLTAVVDPHPPQEKRGQPLTTLLCGEGLYLLLEYAENVWMREMTFSSLLLYVCLVSVERLRIWTVVAMDLKWERA